MSGKRTPGPWTAERATYIDHDYGPIPLIVPSNGENPVAAMSVDYHTETMQANAKAISAVPDLIDVLLEVRDYLDDRADASAEGDPLEYRPNDAMRLLSVVDEALRKAGEDI